MYFLGEIGMSSLQFWGARREGWVGEKAWRNECVRVCVRLFRYNYEHEESVVKTVKNI